ncbi:MAG: hypothetical protein R3F40_03865 [Candidatus Competibacteraceae bacterium]
MDEQVSEYEKRPSEAENRLKEFKLKNVGRMPSEGQTYNAMPAQEATDLSGVWIGTYSSGKSPKLLTATD